MKRKAKKMVLSKETLRVLEDQLLKVAGGETEIVSACYPTACRTCWDGCTITCRPCSP